MGKLSEFQWITIELGLQLEINENCLKNVPWKLSF